MIELPIEKLPEIIFLVAQNIDRLVGAYFFRGVVIASREEQAISKIEEQIKLWNDNRDIPITFNRSRVKALELGCLVKRPSGSELGINQSLLDSEDILTVDIGEDYDT